MVIELCVGLVVGRYAVWSASFPGVLIFSEERDRALRLAIRAFSLILDLKAQRDPALLSPSAVQWAVSTSAVPDRVDAVGGSPTDIFEILRRSKRLAS